MKLEPSDMDTVELREWLYTQSDDAVVAHITDLQTRLTACEREMEAAREVIEQVRFYLKVHTDFPMAKVLAAYDQSKELQGGL